MSGNTLRLRGEKVTVRPFVLPHPSKVSREEYQKYAGPRGYFDHQGFYVYRNKRLIIQGTWFRLKAREESSKYIRIQIDIPNTLDDLWALDVLKSKASPPAEVRTNLKSIIGKITDTGSRVFRGRSSRINKEKSHPLWMREVSNRKVAYRLNRDHPVIQHLLSNGNEKAAKAALAMIEGNFPLEMAYNDCAGGLEQVEPDISRNADFFESALELARLISKTSEELNDFDSLKKKLSKMDPFHHNRKLLELRARFTLRCLGSNIGGKCLNLGETP